MQVDLKKIGEFLTKKKLWGKAFQDFDRQEITLLCEAIFLALEDNPPPGWQPPYIDHRGCLTIPFCAPPQYRWWQAGQSIMDTLDELGATEDVKAKYTQTGRGEGVTIGALEND